MPSPYSVAPAGERAKLREAHDAVIGERSDATGIRRLIAESWDRSLALQLDPDGMLAAMELTGDDLRDYRSAHPLSLVLPTIHRLLIRHTFESGLIVAVGDQSGRLLWIDGDRTLRRKAEGMLFVEGADWSESRVGTSAPGTALTLDHGIQIAGPEHFTRIVHPWSCTAVPVHDPDSGDVLGVIDITGGDDAIAPATLPLLEAAVAAVEAELRIQRLDELSNAPRRIIHHAVPHPTPVLRILGTETGELETGRATIELSERHAEILTVLACHPEGLSADQLAGLVYDGESSVVTLRAEMVRLRRVLGEELAPVSRPYRLPRRIELDAQRVFAFLDRGAHKVALGAYSGQVLPGSTAPGVVALRHEVSARLRDALLTDAAVDTLLDYARTDEAAYDVEVWKACLALLPPKSPRRASIVRRIERIELELRN